MLSPFSTFSPVGVCVEHGPHISTYGGASQSKVMCAGIIYLLFHKPKYSRDVLFPLLWRVSLFFACQYKPSSSYLCTQRPVVRQLGCTVGSWRGGGWGEWGARGGDLNTHTTHSHTHKLTILRAADDSAEGVMGGGWGLGDNATQVGVGKVNEEGGGGGIPA